MWLSRRPGCFDGSFLRMLRSPKGMSKVVMEKERMSQVLCYHCEVNGEEFQKSSYKGK